MADRLYHLGLPSLLLLDYALTRFLQAYSFLDSGVIERGGEGRREGGRERMGSVDEDDSGNFCMQCWRRDKFGVFVCV